MEIMVVSNFYTPMEARTKNIMKSPDTRILIQAMNKLGLPTSTDKVYYTVAIKQAVSKSGAKKINKEVMDYYHPALIAEIDKYKPKVILAMGKVAYQTLTGNYGVKITAQYGRVEQLHGSSIVVTRHPGVLIRKPGDYKPFTAELITAKDILYNVQQYDPGTTEYEILDTNPKCMEWVDKFYDWAKTGKLKVVGADMETTSLDYREAECCVVGIAYAKNKVIIIPREMRSWIKKFFRVPDIDWVWQNGKYDRKVMWRRKLTNFDSDGFHMFPHQHDTEYEHYMLDETSAHDLGTLTKTFLHAAEYKYKMNQNFKAVTLETYPQFFDALCERVAVDADYTLQLHYELQKELHKPENKGPLKCYDKVIMPAANFLARVEQNGMLIDNGPLQEMNKQYDALLASILADIEKLAAPYWDRELYMEESGAKSASEKFKPSSPKQMSWMVFKRLRLKPRRRQGTSTNADVLNSIEEDVPLIKKVLEYRGIKKEQSTYVIGIMKKEDVDNRVRSNFSLHATATGRLSSKEPNVQNLPASKGVGNVRRAIIPAKGKILMEVDYSSAELRWLAFLSKDEALTEIFREGRNLHKETATKLYGPNFTPAQKMRAKAVNFGIAYGREAQSFKDEYNISIEEAEHMITGWLNAYPQAGDYLQWCADQVAKGKFLETPWGNRRRVGLVTKESLHNLQNEFKNFPIQGSSSHTLLYSGMRVERILKSKYDTTIIDLIHDSMLLEVPMDKETVQAVSKFVSEVMIETPKLLFNCDVPFKCDTDLGPDWGNVQAYNNETGNMEIEHKECTPVWVEKIPYEKWIQKVYHWDVYERTKFKTLF